MIFKRGKTLGLIKSKLRVIRKKKEEILGVQIGIPVASFLIYVKANFIISYYLKVISGTSVSI